MKDQKLKKIFEAARKEIPPAPSDDFDAHVMHAIDRHEQAEATSVFDTLNALFPKLAWAAVVVIGICVAGEILASGNSPSLSDSVSQLSDQWLFAAKGF